MGPAAPPYRGRTSATWMNPLQERVVGLGRPTAWVYGNPVQRVIYHCSYHTGETIAIRQQLGHSRLPQFVGNIDDRAPYRPDASVSGRAPRR